MDQSTDRTDDCARSLSIIGAPIEDGASRPGAIMGPAALRTAGLARALTELGHRVEDRGDIGLSKAPPGILPATGGVRNMATIAEWSRLLCRKTHDEMTLGRVPVVIGGDHSLSLGSVSGVARYWREIGRELFVLWLDAHADFNTPATSPSGNMHGMAAAFLCREAGLDDIFGDEPHGFIEPQNLYVFGVRAVDPGERDLLRARGVHVVDMRLLDEFGVSVLMRRIIERVRQRNGVLHVSFDVDFLDPDLAPGVATAVPGGATFREAHLIMELIHDSGLIGSLDVVELNPFLDDRGRSALLLVDLVASLFGRQVMDRASPAAIVASTNRDVGDSHG
jgi:arginase